MQYDEFIGQVQHRARMADSEEAVRAVRVVLQTLGRRLVGGEIKDAASQLPREIALYLEEAEAGSGKYGLDEFYERVAEKEGLDLPIAIHHARAVVSVLLDALSPGEVKDIREQLPREFDALFESESVARMRR